MLVARTFLPLMKSAAKPRVIFVTSAGSVHLQKQEYVCRFDLICVMGDLSPFEFVSVQSRRSVLRLLQSRSEHACGKCLLPQYPIGFADFAICALNCRFSLRRNVKRPRRIAT
jgi:hypothetical protein